MAPSKVRKRRSKKAPEVIEKKIIQKIIDGKRTELQKAKNFLKRLKKTVQLEQTKICELEGAILALHEVLTNEKIE